MPDTPTPLDLDAIRADRARIHYISDGTRGSDRVGRLLNAVSDLITEVGRLRAVTVKPDREAAARAFWNGYEHSETEREGFDAGIEAVWSLLPGRTEAEVKAEALREAAEWLADMDDGRDTGQHRAGRDIIARLRDRADRIEKETDRG